MNRDVNEYLAVIGRKGGINRAKRLSVERLSAIGRKAAAARWAGHTVKKPRKR